MIDIYAAVALALIAAGAGLGILAIFAVGIHREDKAMSLGKAAPGRIAAGLRAITCAYINPQFPP